MKLSALLVSSFLAVSTIVAGCSSSSSSPPGVSCSSSQLGQESCFNYSNLNSDQENAVKSICSAINGTVVSSCPTAGLVGCCKTTASGYTSEQCYYADDSGVPASSDQQSCTTGNGTWSTSQ
jgi:hypothetical protein